MSLTRGKSGFTLVELSIVIIIIGLITGGVLGARSLIGSSERQSLIKELRNIDVATLAFQLEYDSIPGDMRDAYDYWGANCAASAASCNGNGNKQVSRCESTEERKFWNHIVLSEIFNKEDYAPIGSLSFHKLKYKDSMVMPLYKQPYCDQPGFQYFGASYYNLRNQHAMYLMEADSDSTVGTWTHGGISANELYKIDKKIDDGLPYQGTVLGRNANCMTSSNYLIQNNNKDDCVALFYMSF